MLRNLKYQKYGSTYFPQNVTPHSQARVREVMSPAQMNFVLMKGPNVIEAWNYFGWKRLLTST